MKRFIYFSIGEMFYVVNPFYHENISWLCFNAIVAAQYFKNSEGGYIWAENLCMKLNEQFEKEGE